MPSELGAALDAFEAALSEELDAAEEELRARLQRLKDVQEALGGAEEAEEASTSRTAEWYTLLDEFFYRPAAGGG